MERALQYIIQKKLVPMLLLRCTLMLIIINIHFSHIALTHQLSKQPTFISYNIRFLLLRLILGVISFFTYLDFSFIDVTRDPVHEIHA